MQNRSRFLLIALFFSVGMLVVLAGPWTAAPSYANLLATAPATSGGTAEPKGDVARGKVLVQVAGCAGCHGSPKLASNLGTPLAGGNEFKLGPLGTVYAPNLTNLQDWGFKEFDLALRQGIDPYSKRVLAPVMPYQRFHALSDDDVASIGAYLVSLTPVENNIPAVQLGAGMSDLKALPAQSVPAPKTDDALGYGAYLVNTVASCGQCHSPRNGAEAVKGRELSGGTRNFGSDQQVLFAPAIGGGVLSAQGYTADNFIATIRLGIRPRGAKLAPQMPWRRYSALSNADLTAVFAYLESAKINSPWPIQTAAPTAAPTQAATLAATAAR